MLYILLYVVCVVISIVATNACIEHRVRTVPCFSVISSKLTFQ